MSGWSLVGGSFEIEIHGGRGGNFISIYVFQRPELSVSSAENSSDRFTDDKIIHIDLCEQFEVKT